MTYNRNRSTIERMAPFLDAILENQCTIQFPAKHPSAIAYKLREALHNAHYHWSDDFPHYAPIKPNVTILVLPNAVRVVWKGDEFRVQTLQRTVDEAPEIVPPTIPQVSKPKQRRRIEDVRSAEEVVGAVLTFSETADEFNFPSAIFDAEQLRPIFEWADANGWRIVWHQEDGITLTQRAIDPEITWRPEDERT